MSKLKVNDSLARRVIRTLGKIQQYEWNEENGDYVYERQDYHRLRAAADTIELIFKEEDHLRDLINRLDVEVENIRLQDNRGEPIKTEKAMEVFYELRSDLWALSGSLEDPYTRNSFNSGREIKQEDWDDLNWDDLDWEWSYK